MSDTNLRNKLIRMAHSNPELRKDLLPLIEKKSSAPSSRFKPLTSPKGMYIVKVVELTFDSFEDLEADYFSSEKIVAKKRFNSLKDVANLMKKYGIVGATFTGSYWYQKLKGELFFPIKVHFATVRMETDEMNPPDSLVDALKKYNLR